VDRTLTSHLTWFATHLLSTSPAFEPELPGVQQKALRGLELLRSLGDITQLSLLTPPETPAAPEVPSPAAPKNPRAPSPSASNHDARLTEALLKLRGSNRVLKRDPGIYTPILRPKHS
jgi:hypothetical protein